MTPKRVLMLLYRNLEAALHDHRVLKEAKALAREGFNVDILVFGQEKKTHVTDEGVELHQVVEVRRNKLRQRTARARIVKQFFSQKRYAVVHCHDFLMLETAVWAGLHRRTPLIYDSHEYFIGSMGMAGRSALVRKLIQWLERFYARRVKAVITVGESIARILERDLSQDKVFVVHNTPSWDLAAVKGAVYKPPSPGGDDKVILIYHGLISSERGVALLADMMAYLPERYELVFLGDYDNATAAMFRPYGDRVRFMGLVPIDEMRNYLMTSHIGVQPIQDVCLSYRFCLPNKLYQAIHCALPVVISDLPEMRKVVDRYKVGALVKFDDPEGFATTIVDAVENGKLADWSSNCIPARTELSWSRDADVMLGIFEDVLKVH